MSAVSDNFTVGEDSLQTWCESVTACVEPLPTTVARREGVTVVIAARQARGQG
jgi:hypothetical protein